MSRLPPSAATAAAVLWLLWRHPGLGLQIIPTVNAGSGDAEGEKRVASMLKHFRGLVDETAAKSRFLSAFHRKRASASSADLAARALPVPDTALLSSTACSIKR
jgi:hypothetical protein